MTKSPSDLAYEASEALEHAANELRAQLDYLELVLSALKDEAETLEEIGELVGGTPGQVCKRAARRISIDEIEMLNTILGRITREAVQLIEDADEALQTRLPFAGESDESSA